MFTKAFFLLFIPVSIFILYKCIKHYGLVEAFFAILLWSIVFFCDFKIILISIPFIFFFLLCCIEIREELFRSKVAGNKAWSDRLEDFDLLHKDDWHQNFTQNWGNDKTREIKGFRDWFSR